MELVLNFAIQEMDKEILKRLQDYCSLGIKKTSLNQPEQGIPKAKSHQREDSGRIHEGNGYEEGTKKTFSDAPRVLGEKASETE